MMDAARKIPFPIAFLLLGACATPVGSFSPLPAAGQISRYTQGRPVVTTSGQNTVVVLGPSEVVVDPTQRITFLVLVANKSDAPIEVGPSDIEVFADSGNPVHVFTALELEREARKHARDVRIAAALGAMSNSLNAANAGYSSSYGTVSGTGTYGSYSGTYNSNTYDSGAAAAAQIRANAANQRLISNANADASAVLAQSQNGAMQVETVSPGKSYFTPVTLGKIGRAKGLNFRVRVGGDSYQISWSFQMQ